ncbi:recombinase RecU [Bacillus thuringiensis serovar cameroun]|nr:recombinase RecU [Bacillus thuringiensis serovar cameroun]
MAKRKKVHTKSNGYLVEQTERAPVDYLQYIDEAATPVMFDVMIEFDEDHKRVAINIEVAKEKIANKKCRLLKV